MHLHSREHYLKNGLSTVSRRFRRSRPGLYLKQGLSNISWRLLEGRPCDEATRVAQELRKNGIAVTSAERLGLDGDLIQDLNRKCLALADDPDALELGKDPRKDPTVQKDFFFRLLGHRLIRVNKADIFNKIALDPIVLSIVNEYLMCYPWLMRYNVWLNLPAKGDPMTSQLWHRDHVEDYKLQNLVKIFLMIEEISIENGAFSYIPGTQQGGWRMDLNPPVSVLEGNAARRTLDEHMRQVVPESEWVTCAGSPGTIIFTDTSGFHKGGYVRSGRRLLFKAQYGDWLCRHGAMVRINGLSGWEMSKLRAIRWAASWR